MTIVRDHYRLPASSPGSALEIPYVEIHGSRGGPHLTLLAGVHGCEYAGMAALRQFISRIDPGQLRGRITAVPVVNIAAFQSRTPFVVPEDGKNLNRCFPGREDGTYSDVLAHHIFTRFIQSTDYLIDLHSGDIPEALEPMTVYDESPQADKARALARAYGTSHVIRQPASSRTIGGSTSAAAADAGIPAIVAEAGANGLVDSASVAVHVRGLRNATAHLGMLPFVAEPAPAQVEHDTGWNWIHTPIGGWWEPLVSLGDPIAGGQPVGAVTNLFGDLVHEVLAPEAGVPLFITSSPAVADGGLLLALAKQAGE
jgi:uncharacterized protein